MTNNNHLQQPLKEIRHETAYGPDKISLVMQFPSETSETTADALRQDVLAILEEELLRKEFTL